VTNPTTEKPAAAQLLLLAGTVSSSAATAAGFKNSPPPPACQHSLPLSTACCCTCVRPSLKPRLVTTEGSFISRMASLVAIHHNCQTFTLNYFRLRLLYFFLTGDYRSLPGLVSTKRVNSASAAAA